MTSRRPEPFIDVGTIARRLNVSGETVRSWIRSGKLKAYRTPTGRYRIPTAALKTILSQKSQDSQTAR